MKCKPANGTMGFLIPVGNNYMFRVYGEGTSFKDYDLRHSDLCVIIHDEDSAFYEDKHGVRLDHSPDTLGYNMYGNHDE